MRRVVRARATGDSVDRRAGLRRAGVAFGVALACALSAPAAAMATTIHVDETQESATFVNGGATPADYYDSIAKLSNDNGKCSLREAIAASNTQISGRWLPRRRAVLATSWTCRPVHYHVYDTLIVLRTGDRPRRERRATRQRPGPRP